MGHIPHSLVWHAPPWKWRGPLARIRYGTHLPHVDEEDDPRGREGEAVELAARVDEVLVEEAGGSEDEEAREDEARQKVEEL
eukprot:1595980-Prymnesium_polylepis.2